MQKVVPVPRHAGALLSSIGVFALILSACAKSHNAYYWTESFRGHGRTGGTIEVHASLGTALITNDPGACASCRREMIRWGAGGAIGYMASPQLAIYYLDVQWLEAAMLDTHRSQRLRTLGGSLRRWISSRVWVQLAAGLADLQSRDEEGNPSDEPTGYGFYTSYGIGWEILSHSTASLDFHVRFDASNVPGMETRALVPVTGLGFTLY